jgi:hypothetical protein
MVRTFEQFLEDRHAEIYHGLDDDMVDAFDKWLSELDNDQLISYANDYGIRMFAVGKSERFWKEWKDKIIKKNVR